MTFVRALAGAAPALVMGSATSAEVALVGVIGSRAVLVVDGGEPQDHCGWRAHAGGRQADCPRWWNGDYRVCGATCAPVFASAW